MIFNSTVCVKHIEKVIERECRIRILQFCCSDSGELGGDRQVRVCGAAGDHTYAHKDRRRRPRVMCKARVRECASAALN